MRFVKLNCIVFGRKSASVGLFCLQILTVTHKLASPVMNAVHPLSSASRSASRVTSFWTST